MLIGTDNMLKFSLVQSVFWHTVSAGRFSDGGASALSGRSEINHPVEFRRCWWCWWRRMTLLSVKTERMRLIKLRRPGRDGGRDDSSSTMSKVKANISSVGVTCTHQKLKLLFFKIWIIHKFASFAGSDRHVTGAVRLDTLTHTHFLIRPVR